MSRYHLRRIGTNDGAPQLALISLDDEVIKFGRNPDQVDVILQSRLYSNMISREHAEIRRVRNVDGTLSYQLCDKSLNGTYVNETRAKETVLLHPGDVIKFGHVNGAAIGPGQHAPQPHAEFTFTFEKVPRNVTAGAGGVPSMAPVAHAHTQPYASLQSGYQALSSQYAGAGSVNVTVPQSAQAQAQAQHVNRLSAAAAYQNAYTAAGYPHLAPAAALGAHCWTLLLVPATQINTLLGHAPFSQTCLVALFHCAVAGGCIATHQLVMAVYMMLLAMTSHEYSKSGSRGRRLDFGNIRRVFGGGRFWFVRLVAPVDLVTLLRRRWGLALG